MSSIKISPLNIDEGQVTQDHDIDFWIKPEFLSVMGCNIEQLNEKSAFDLFKDHKLYDFIHNENGPAIVNHQNGEVNYIVNGKPATEEEIQRIKHNTDFNDRLNTEIKA
jgi:hypothetical protein